MSKVNCIHHVINKQFGLKAKPWRISVLIDIILKKNICAIASTNAGKNLVYQTIPVVTKGFLPAISTTIAFTEDQVRVFSKYCFYISF